MPKYRKKPVVIEAVQVKATDFNGKTFDGHPFSDHPEWLEQALSANQIIPVTPNGTDYAEWEISTLEGTMLASPGNWIIRGVNGELYPCRNDVFEKTYERVEEEAGV